MSRVTHPALRGSFLGTVLRLWNPIMKRLLASPLHWPLSRWFALIAWTGRKSGRRYSTPVSYVRDGSTVYITTGDGWWLNVRDGGSLAIRLRGRWQEAHAMPVVDRAASRAEHQRIFRAHGWYRWLAGIPPDGRGGADPDALDRALEAGRVLVRVDLEQL